MIATNIIQSEPGRAEAVASSWGERNDDVMSDRGLRASAVQRVVQNARTVARVPPSPGSNAARSGAAAPP